MSRIINGVRVEGPQEVTLCGNKICCPKLKRLPDGRFMLTDNDGNSVILTAEQARLMNNGVQFLEGNDQLLCE